MIDLREETLIKYDSQTLRTQGLFEVKDQVGYVELENSKGSWKGFVPKSSEIFEFENGKLIAPSGREIPGTRKSSRYFYYLILVAILALAIFWLMRR